MLIANAFIKDIGKGHGKISISERIQDDANGFRLIYRNTLRSADNTARSLIKSTVHLIKLFVQHIAELFTQEVVTIRVLHVALIKSKHCVELVSGEIELVSHDDTFQSVGGLPLRICPLPFRTNYITRIGLYCLVLFFPSTFPSHLDKLALGYFFRIEFAVSQFLEVGYLIPFALRND